jgi:uncharacterized LabA/DUF88 family protein
MSEAARADVDRRRIVGPPRVDADSAVWLGPDAARVSRPVQDRSPALGVTEAVVPSGDVAVLVDYENMRQAALAYFPPESVRLNAHFCPRRLAVMVAEGRQLRHIEVFRGEPSRWGKPSRWRSFDRFMRHWRVVLQLRASSQPLILDDDHWQEKGVDVTLALAAARLAFSRTVGTIIVCSEDRDLLPVAAELSDLVRVEVAGWRSMPSADQAPAARAVRRYHRLDLEAYERCRLDPYEIDFGDLRGELGPDETWSSTLYAERLSERMPVPGDDTPGGTGELSLAVIETDGEVVEEGSELVAIAAVCGAGRPKVSRPRRRHRWRWVRRLRVRVRGMLAARRRSHADAGRAAAIAASHAPEQQVEDLERRQQARRRLTTPDVSAKPRVWAVVDVQTGRVAVTDRDPTPRPSPAPRRVVPLTAKPPPRKLGVGRR